MSWSKIVFAVLICGVAGQVWAQNPEVIVLPELAKASSLHKGASGRLFIRQVESDCPGGELGAPCQVSSIKPVVAVPFPSRVYKDIGPGTEQHIVSSNVASEQYRIWFLGETKLYRAFHTSGTNVEPTVLAEKEDVNSFGEVAVDRTHVYWTENAGESGQLFRVPKHTGGAAELVYSNPVGTLRQLKAVPDDGVLFVTSLVGGDFFRDTLVRVEVASGTSVVTEGRALTESYTFDDDYVYQITAFNTSPRTLVRSPLSNIDDDVSGVVLSSQNDGTSIPYVVVDQNNVYYYRKRSGLQSSVLYRLDKTQWAAGTPQPITGDVGEIVDLQETRGNLSSLVWVNSGGAILRLRKAQALTYSVDLSINAIEVTQAVQTTDNQVRLVARKPTTARVYPVLNAASNVSSISASVELIAEDAQTGIEITPAVSPQTITLTPGEAFDRRMLEQTTNFDLPSEWIDGERRVRLTARIRSLGIVDTDAANDEFMEDGLTNAGLLFEPKAAVCAKFLPIASTSGLTYRTRSIASGTPTPGFNRILERFNALYAAERIIYYTQYETLRKPQFLGTPQPFNLLDNADGDHLIAALWEHDVFDSPPDWCGGSNARTHYSAMVDPGIDTGTSGGYGSFSLGYSWSLMRSPAGADTIAHEFGHNYNTVNGDDDDWQHVNCGLPAGSGFNNVYPYRDDSIGVSRIDGNLVPTAGWGFDRIGQRVFRPDERADYMSYCNSWVSDYRWHLVMDAVNDKPATRGVTPTERQTVSDVVAVFGLVDELESSVDILSANLALSSMNINVPEDAATRSLPARSALETYTLSLLSGDGEVLHEQEVFPVRGADGLPGAGYYFAAMVPWNVATQNIRVEQSLLGELTAIEVSPNAPTVTLTSPVAGSVVTDSLTLSWVGNDTDGDPLQYTVQYSADGGITWSNIASGLTDATWVLEDAFDLAGSSNGALRVLANDGVRIGMDTVSGLIVDNRSPLTSITGIENGRVFEVNDVVAFRATAIDTESGPVDQAHLSWSLQGPTSLADVGAQASLAGLHPGTHTVDVSAQDPLTGLSGPVVSQTFAVAPKFVPDGVSPDMDGVCGDPAYLADEHPIPILFDDGTQAQVHMVRADGYVYLCYSGLKFAGNAAESAAYVLFDRDGDGGPLLMNDNLLFIARFDETVAYQVGVEGFDDIPAGLFALSSIAGDAGSVEFQISEELLDFQQSGWNRLIGMVVGQVNDVAQNTEVIGRWPQASDPVIPDMYGQVALGKQAQTITLSSSGIISGGEIVHLDATASSGLPVQYSSSTPQTCEVFDGNFLQPLAEGICRVTASQPGSAAYLPAPVILASAYVTQESCLVEDDCDDDGSDDLIDNCLLIANPDQTDTDADGIGNACDADYNNDCVVNFLDIFYFTNNSFLNDDPLADHNNDGVANFLDYVFVVDQFLGTPGPSLVSVQCE